MKDIAIIVATHKNYRMPKDEMYYPLEVGASLRKENTDFVKDNIGDNISDKNFGFCELTGVYWAWKNLKNDYIGLTHYRRHFSLSKNIFSNENKKFSKLLTHKDIDILLNEVDIILPKKRNYIIESLYDHYIHTMHEEPLVLTGEIIKDYYPSYYEEFEKLRLRRSAHMFNMFIMKKEYFDKYCEWLFNILFKLETRIDSSSYSDFHARFYGRISELLLDVWIYTNGYKYKEINFLEMQKVNWLKKGSSFLKAKFLGEKYEKSF